MNKLKSLLIAGVTFLTASAALVAPAGAAAGKPLSSGPLPEPQITAQTAALVDASTGRILYDKDMHARMFPASLTKIMTGILAVEHGSGDDVITVSDSVVKSIPRGTANAAFSPGEQISQDSALYALFLASANDAALAIAEHTGGSTQNFTKMMNDEATALGAKDTHFANPSGLPDQNNYSSAYDLSLFTRRAVQLPVLMNYFGAKTYTLPPTNKRAEAVPFTSLHHMLKPYTTKFSYDGVIAGKTGWETMSGWTLVTVARRNGKTLIATVMRSSNQWTSYSDTIALFNYGFSLNDSALPNLGTCELTGPPSKAELTMRKESRTLEAYAPVHTASAAEPAKTSRPSNAAYIVVAVVAIAAILTLPLLLIRHRRAAAKRARRALRLERLERQKYPAE